nr:MAG TPA: hypothetical protein [Crassvirales sp.]
MITDATILIIFEKANRIRDGSLYNNKRERKYNYLIHSGL